MYMLNILVGFLMICYQVASYYTWSATQKELMERNRIDAQNYDRLPKSHLVFLVYLVLMTLSKYNID